MTRKTSRPGKTSLRRPKSDVGVATSKTSRPDKTRYVFLCNGANEPGGLSANSKVTHLTYIGNGNSELNVRIKLPKFVERLDHIPPRVLDLLEIAAYVFAADRLTRRGSNDSVEFHSWQRIMHFCMRVRDDDFWNQSDIKKHLAKVLCFMSGDHEYHFDFSPGHSTPPTSLFDQKECNIVPHKSPCVILFSGGLDSLAGVIEQLRTTKNTLYLVSHESGQPSVKRTQQTLVKNLKESYPNRIQHYSFNCGLSGSPAKDETQRTRAFLYCSIACALLKRFGINSFFIYENGVTSLNFPRRQDAMNARASRTTHPKVLSLMSHLFCKIVDKEVTIENPFWNQTKTDIFTILNKDRIGRNLINSAVSCSRGSRNRNSATHCGQCFQCVDRRFAAYAAGLQDVDNEGIYSMNICADTIAEETKTVVLDYIRQAMKFRNQTEDDFVGSMFSDFTEILEYMPVRDENAAASAIYKMCQTHGEQVMRALDKIFQEQNDLEQPVKNDSLVQLINSREHLKENPKRLAKRIENVLANSIPIAFQKEKPKNEGVLNDHVAAILSNDTDKFKREFPYTQFALSKVVPDHEMVDCNLIIECKFIRGKTSPSRVTEGIAADITKYPKETYILFVVYDPCRSIVNDTVFKKDMESRRNNCLVAIIR